MPRNLPPSVLRAIAIGSLPLFNALQRKAEGKKGERRREKLLRYLIRMATRPTPFGAFAGVALGEWSDRTELRIADEPLHTRTRLDMEELFTFVWALESLPAVRRRLNVAATSAAQVRRGRLLLVGVDTTATPAGGPNVTLRATGAVKRAMELARQPIAYAALASDLLAGTPGATEEKVEKLLADLWRHGFLITDLRPPLTDPNPAAHVLRRLADIPEAAGACERLAALVERTTEFDACPAGQTGSGFSDLAETARALTGSSTESPLQVDATMSLAANRIHRAAGEEVVRAAELLLTLTPFPNGLPKLEVYRTAFEARYGAGAHVPLLDLVDDDGSFATTLSETFDKTDAGFSARVKQRNGVLLGLATRALHDRTASIEIDAALLADLQTWDPVPEALPPSLDLYASVAARSAAAVDAGDFRIIVGPNIGASAAGRNLGRFADLLPGAEEALRETARLEEEGRAAVFAELVYLPEKLRTTNVVIRPAIRAFEIGVEVSAHRGRARTIPLDEVMVTLRDGRFAFRWTQAPPGRGEVIVCAGHMLNHVRAPKVCRLLADLSRDGHAQLSWFDWGPASDFPYLPRVTSGRIVLRPAQWRIDLRTRDSELWPESDFRHALARWREKWNAPRAVFVNSDDDATDRRLLLDLEEAAHVELLRGDLRRMRRSGRIVLLEALPEAGEHWVEGPKGNHFVELVVSMAIADRTAVEIRTDAMTAVPRSARLRAPGSDWLYAQIYCAPSAEDTLIGGAMRELAEDAVDAGLADAWMFLRYSDPEPHLRLRFRGDPEKLLRELLPRLCDWSARLIDEEEAFRISFETYDREVERYGGVAGVETAEVIFAADSAACAELLDIFLAKETRLERTDLAMLSIDDFLSSLGFTEIERTEWSATRVAGRHEVAVEYRQRHTALISLLRDTSSAGDEVVRVLGSRRERLAAPAARLRALEDSGELRRTRADLCDSYIHLLCNRLLGRDRTRERRVLALYARAREAIRHLSGGVTTLDYRRD